MSSIGSAIIDSSVFCDPFAEINQNLRAVTLPHVESECGQQVANGARKTCAIAEAECREVRAQFVALGLAITS